MIDSVLESGCAPKRLASMREMAGFFKVSTATVQRALKELVDDDYLTVKPGIGLFTNPDRGWLREKTEVIGVLAADGRQIYYENFLWDLLSAVGRRITSGRKLLYPINLFHTAGHVPESLAFLSMTGLIWLGPDFAPSAAADAFFAALTVPAVTVNDPRAGHSCISYDMELEGYQVGRKLLGEGRRSPVVIAKRPDMPQIAGLRRAFSESGTPFNDRLLVLRNPGMADRLHTIFDLLEMPEAIYGGRRHAARHRAGSPGAPARLRPLPPDRGVLGLETRLPGLGRRPRIRASGGNRLQPAFCGDRRRPPQGPPDSEKNQVAPSITKGEFS